MSIDDLLRQAALGDPEAFAQVCDQVAGAVYTLVHRIIEDRPQAEQVTAEVLVEVWRSAPRFSPAEGSGLSWIMTMARRRATRGTGTAGAGLARGQERPTAIDQGKHLLASSGLASLPEPQREAMLMALWGYDQRQVAAVTGVPASTAAGWLRDGLLRLSSRPEQPGEAG